MLMSEIRCPECDTRDLKVHATYAVQSGERRRLYYCTNCHSYFSETYGTALAGLRTSLSRIQQILEALNDGLGVNATGRTFQVSKNTLKTWQERLSPVKDALLLYALCHQFLHQLIEGSCPCNRCRHKFSIVIAFRCSYPEVIPSRSDCIHENRDMLLSQRSVPILWTGGPASPSRLSRLA
jgi:transposase-like protein